MSRLGAAAIMGGVCLMSFGLLSLNGRSAGARQQVDLGSCRFRIAVAEGEEAALGLARRSTIAPDEGVAFLLDVRSEVRIDMSQTMIPLTLLLLDKDQRVTDVRSLEARRPVVVRLRRTARWAVELPHEAVRKCGLRPGVMPRPRLTPNG